MAGDLTNGAEFVILNGVKFDDDGKLVPLAEPYPGSNLFLAASVGPFSSAIRTGPWWTSS